MINVNEALITASLPSVLAKQAETKAFAYALSQQAKKIYAAALSVRVYAHVYELPEEVLDILATDLNVEWYDFEGTLQEKRRTIHDCMQVHRYKGTKYAVETALRSVYKSVRVVEWFEYGGEPYHFKVIIYDSSNDQEKRDRTIAKVQYYKNLRSVLEETIYEIGISTDISVNAAFRPCGLYKKIYCEVTNNVG